MNGGGDNEQFVEALSNEFSKTFSEIGKNISPEQIIEQIERIINLQIYQDGQENGYANPNESISRALNFYDKFIKNLCIRLQLAGLLD